ncbi:rhodanese-like domain-containing protein [Methanosarcina sp. T3]|uniref:rhodanese-like domain-containing protein n=1 Tax=Methanosarcina sp. T3 TaxID=3439062 RepID=UPI003F855D30
MNKQFMLFFAAILLAFFVITPGIAAADTYLDGYKNVNVCKAEKMIEQKDVFLLDVRTPAEFNKTHIEGATLIPLKNVTSLDSVELPSEKLLPARISEVPVDKKILVYCKTGGRSATACSLLVNAGYKKVYNMEGGIDVWLARGCTVDTNASKANEILRTLNIFLLDVRTPAEFNKTHIEEATLIPFKNVPAQDSIVLPSEQLLAQRLCEVQKDKPILVYCKSGARSDAARDLLVDSGYRYVYNMEVGIDAWISEGYTVDVNASIANSLLNTGTFFLLDVRTPAEFNAEHIEGATLIPLKNVPDPDPDGLLPEEFLENRLWEVPGDKPILVYCKSGARSDAARDLLVDSGYRNVYNMMGGIAAWKAEGYPTVCPEVCN